MRLASLSLALALGALSVAHATPPGPSVSGPTAHNKSPAHHDSAKPAPTDHHTGHADHQGQAGHSCHTDQHHADQHHPDHPHHHHDKDGHAGGGQGTASFQGKVLMVQCNADGKGGRVWARDGRGQVQMFHVSGGTTVGGTTKQGLQGLKPGSTVCVQANQQSATQVRVTGQSSSGGEASGQGTFTGRVVSAHRDRDGDHGSLTVQAGHGGRTRHFKVTGATHVAQPSSGGQSSSASSGGRSKQFVKPGESVTVHCHGDHALQIDVHSHSGGQSQGGSTSVASNSHRTK